MAQVNKISHALLALFIFVYFSSISSFSNADKSTETLTSKVIASGLSSPWGMTWLGTNKLLVTEKTVGGWIIDVRDGKKQQVTGWPSKINTENQGGLLDVVADPYYAENRRIYFSYSHQKDKQNFTTQVAVAELRENRLSNINALFTAHPYSKKVHHYGSRLAFKGDLLFITVGDRGQRHRAQDLSDSAGKVHRINKDGSIPEGNPFIGKKAESGRSIPATIYSYGHRNPQGLFIDNSGNVWIHEHGPRGGDELNRVEKGLNYGWPVITYGKEYWGPSIGEGTHKEGMEQPLYTYIPSIAPSGLVRYESDLFKEWKGDFLIGALKKRHLNRLTNSMGETNAVGQSAYQELRYLKELDLRIRDIEIGPQGEIYLLTDDYNGQLIRITP